MYLKSKSVEEKTFKALPLSACYAKTIVSEEGLIEFGLNLKTHSLIVGTVASLLIELLPIEVQKSVFPLGVALIAASHDIGKANPFFMKRIYQAVCKEVAEEMEEFQGITSNREEATGYHSGVSQAFFKEIHEEVASIVGQHHGFYNSVNYFAEDEKAGGKPWNRIRNQLFEELTLYFNQKLPHIEGPFIHSAIAGLVTVADWIGSGTVFQNLKELQSESIALLARKALKQAGFMAPKIKKNLSFKDIFQFDPWPSQQTFINSVQQTSVYVLEALMGEGKTEAALYGAYKKLEKGEATGIYFALPTRLTSERMHSRMAHFLKTILEEPNQQKVFLLHGSAWLFETALGEEGAVGGSWFDAAKRKILAPFGVGTLDQALLSILHVKHKAVRSFALAGKVVILDEIHSYDAYTGTLIQYLLKELEALGCTVIMLSATLTKERKEELLDIPLDNSSRAYPLITEKNKSSVSVLQPAFTNESSVEITCCSKYQATINEALTFAFNGAQVLWIENTVAEAQDVFLQIAARATEAGIEAGLLHSRFPSYQRLNLEEYWVDMFGKAKEQERKKTGRILVGTQVLEQSLDIDADLLISKLAPSDMLLQRLGRLWRHRSNDDFRPNGAKRKMIVLTPCIDQQFSPWKGFGPSGNVYAPYVLWRTYHVWKALSQITIPRDVISILERTYSDQEEYGSYAAIKEDIKKKKAELKRKALNGIALVGPKEDESAATRHSELETCPVLLLQSLPAKDSMVFTLLDGSTIDCSQKTESEKKSIAKKIFKNIIFVAAYCAPDPIGLNELSWIRPYFYVEENEKTRLRVALIEKSGSIRALHGGQANDQYLLSYETYLGYRALKREKETHSYGK